MAETSKCACGAAISEGQNFCGDCGRHINALIDCPHCNATVAMTNFCGQCGGDLTQATHQAQFYGSTWERGIEDFAVNIPGAAVDKSVGAIEIRHGSRALIFEQGKLVQEVKSGRYPLSEEGFLARLLKKPKSVSAMVVDAGDVDLTFDVPEMKTADGKFTDFTLTLVVRLADADRFFVNVMKERGVYKIADLRRRLFPEIRDALQEAVQRHAYDKLGGSREVKSILVSRLEAHLRSTLERDGLSVGHIRDLAARHDILDGSDRKAADITAEAQAMRTSSAAAADLDDAKLGEGDRLRGLRGEKIKGERKDVALDAADQDTLIYRAQLMGERELKAMGIDVGFIEKRLEIYKALKNTDMTRIKTDEDFRKFQLEVDRDGLLDDSEWQEFKDEILWKKEDRHRERSFLLDKIAVQENAQLAKLKLAARTDLSLEEKKAEFKILEQELSQKIALEKQRIEGLIETELARTKFEQSKRDVEAFGDKERDIRTALMDLDLKRKEAEQRLELEGREAKQEIDIELAREKARKEISFYDIEIKEKKSELGINNLAKMKAIKRQDLFEKDLHEEEKRQRALERKLKEEAQAHAQKMDELRLAHEQEMAATAQKSQQEIDRMTVLSGLNLEQLISISDDGQAKILGDLGQSQTLKGMSAEEIMAMKDPAALGKALEERARNTSNDDLKALYERLISQTQSSMEQVAGAHKEGADRAERMSSEALRALSGQTEHRVASERIAADRTERMAGAAMGDMRDVSSTARSSASTAPGAPGSGGIEGTHLCANCRNVVAADKKFCPNCGEKVFGP